jgi:hypothetical protein
MFQQVQLELAALVRPISWAGFFGNEKEANQQMRRKMLVLVNNRQLVEFN